MTTICTNCNAEIEEGFSCTSCTVKMRIVDNLRKVGEWLEKSEYGDEPGWHICPSCKRTKREGHAEYCHWQKSKKALDEAMKVAEKIAEREKR